ncbi:MAG: hypothetical protein KC435_14695, partial [Thermomicrobiales bacterium]|nr:hypothetical protein [Thermomicrobiales bacterium]
AIIIARQADNTYDICLGDTTTGTHTLVSTGTPLASPASQYVPEAGFVPGTTIALVRDDYITTISTTDATILNHSQSSYNFTTPWQLTPDGQFAYAPEQFGISLTSVDVLDLTTGALSRIEFPGGSPANGGIIDATHSRAYALTVGGDTVQITRYDFSDPTTPYSTTVDGTILSTNPYSSLGYTPFDVGGNFYLPTFTWTTVQGSPDPVAANTTIHIIDPQMNEIGTISVDAGTNIIFALTVIDETVYAVMADLADNSIVGTYRVAADGTTTFLAQGFGFATNDPQRLFILDAGSFSVLDLTDDTQSTPLVVPANSLRDSRVFDGKYLAVSATNGTDTIVHILDVNGNVTTVTIPDASFAQFDYTD